MVFADIVAALCFCPISKRVEACLELTDELENALECLQTRLFEAIVVWGDKTNLAS